jgi:hypothetical protein
MLLNQFLFSSASLASLRSAELMELRATGKAGSPSALFSSLSAGLAACGGESGRQDSGGEV